MTNAIHLKSPPDDHHNHHKQQPTSMKFRQFLYSNNQNNNLFSSSFSTTISGSTTSSSRHSNASTTTPTSSPRLSSYSDDSNNNNPNPTPSSPYTQSPWNLLSHELQSSNNSNSNSNKKVYHSRGKRCLIGSLVREEGHVHSLAVRNRVLFAGSESRNIRVWKNFNNAGGFKCSRGLVKAIVVSSIHNKVFTGHQDGKIRVWTHAGKRVGTLPKLADFIKSSVNPRNYVEVRKHHKVPKIKHYDAVSCLSLNEESGLLYSGSWDKTIKVWRVEDGKCLESIEAHHDAINSIVVGLGGLVFSGSADGTIKAWRRVVGENKHICVGTLLSQENAVTALAVAEEGSGAGVLYGATSEGLVRFWEKEERGEMVYGGVLRGHKLAVLCLGTAGSLLFSGSTDKSICVWKREEGGIHTCIAVLSGHSGPVKCLAVEQDREDEEEEEEEGRRWIVYSGSLDKSVKIWRVSENVFDEST